MTSTTLHKVNQTEEENKKSSKMDYFTALETIEKYEAVLNKAGSQRMAEPAPADTNFGERGMLTGIALHCVGLAGYLGISSTTGVFDVTMLVIWGVMGVPVFMAAGGHLGVKHPDLLAPFKYREEIMNHQQDLLFYRISEEAYSKIEAEVLKKTRKALKIINKNLALEGKKMCYSNSHGHEGFYVEQSFSLTEIDRLKLQAATTLEQKKKMMEILPFNEPAFKALTS